MTVTTPEPTPAVATIKAAPAEAGSYAAQTQRMTQRAMPEQVSLRPLGEVLQSLAELREDWDSYGAIPPSPMALERAWHHASALVEHGLAMPEVFPTRSGGIQLEWHRESVELEWEIDADGATGVFIFDDHR